MGTTDVPLIAIAINAEITLLYWQIGHRIQTEILQGHRAEYGKQIIATLAQQLTQTYGRGWSARQLNYYLLISPKSFPIGRFCTHCLRN